MCKVCGHKTGGHFGRESRFTLTQHLSLAHPHLRPPDRSTSTRRKKASTESGDGDGANKAAEPVDRNKEVWTRSNDPEGANDAKTILRNVVELGLISKLAKGAKKKCPVSKFLRGLADWPYKHVLSVFGVIFKTEKIWPLRNPKFAQIYPKNKLFRF